MMQEFKGGLQASCLRPWAFKDKSLEQNFQQYMSRSALDRTRRVITVVMSCAWTLRLIFIALRIIFPYNWTGKELTLIVARLSMMVFGTSAVLFEWSETYKVWLSWLMIWVARMALLVAITEQAGVQQDDSNILFVPLMFTTMSGLLIPFFGEFVFYISVLYMVKPLSILLMGSHGCPVGVAAPCPGLDFQTVLVQNICLLFTAIGVFYHFFSDTRRHWLLSFEIFGRHNELRPTSESDISTTEAFLHERQSERELFFARFNEVVPIDQDVYFTEEERAEQLEIWRQERAEIMARNDELLREQPTQSWKRVGGALGGRVYKAIDSDTGERLALKVLPGGVAHATFFLREVRRARALAHPSLAAVRGGAVQGGALCLVTDYCGGGSVEALLRRTGGPLATETARALGRQAAAGLAYLHRQRLLHGNLKPSNCLLLRGGAALKLTDYGPLNRLLDLADTRLRRFAAVAPEVLRREGHGRPADVWSLGSAAPSPAVPVLSPPTRRAADAPSVPCRSPPQRAVFLPCSTDCAVI